MTDTKIAVGSGLTTPDKAYIIATAWRRAPTLWPKDCDVLRVPVLRTDLPDPPRGALPSVEFTQEFRTDGREKRRYVIGRWLGVRTPVLSEQLFVRQAEVFGDAR